MADKQEQAERGADRPTVAQERAAERVGVVLESEDTRRSRAMAEAHAEATRLKMDETVPGGRFEVNGRLVDAEGRPLKD
jgi:hypothetical protein